MPPLVTETRPFLYLRDPLFRGCVVLYFVNRWGIKPACPDSFWSSSFNDLICIPFWVPVLVALLRKLRLRDHDEPPRVSEILIPLFVWSVIFEIWLPRLTWFQGLATADYQDLFWYALGALLAAGWWKLWYAAPNDRRKTEL